VVGKDVPAGGRVAKADGAGTIGIARRRRAAARGGRADIVVSTLDDVDTAALAAGRLATRKTWERDDRRVTGRG
jgi:beta-phosphoglucomutase